MRASLGCNLRGKAFQSPTISNQGQWRDAVACSCFQRCPSFCYCNKKRETFQLNTIFRCQVPRAQANFTPCQFQIRFKMKSISLCALLLWLKNNQLLLSQIIRTTRWYQKFRLGINKLLFWD